MVKLLIALGAENSIYVVIPRVGLSELRVCLVGISDTLPPMSATI